MNNDPNQQPQPPVQPANPYVQPQVIAPQQPVQPVAPVEFGAQPFQPVINPATGPQVPSQKRKPIILIVALVVIVLAAIGLFAFVFVTMK